ncbi:MAG TPA: hypothetical protein VK814_00205 [Acidobacteriaceae bacterium]|jgi:hypothetical protein|nr:hypothetical protein [Acidobacteriaceae bacterium]
MRLLSAIDAIGPAWNHTSRILIAPRNWRLALKIGAVAFFAQVGGCNSSFSSPGRHLPSAPPALIAGIVALAFLLASIALLIGLAFFYLSSRLQFVLFEVVLRSDTTLSPIWRRYASATWHWIGLKILYFLAAIICAAPILVPLVIHFIREMGPSFHGATPQDPVALFVAILGFISAIFFIVVLIGIGYALLYDFGLPSMALESTSISDTVSRVWSLIRSEPGPVALYVLMRFLLAIGGSLAADSILVVGALIAFMPFGGVGLIAWLSLRHAGLAGHVAMIAIWIVLGLILLALVVLAAIILSGFVYTFLQAYALYFLGGRYPLVGAYLEPFLAPPYPYPGYPGAGAPPPIPPRQPGPDTA